MERRTNFLASYHNSASKIQPKKKKTLEKSMLPFSKSNNNIIKFFTFILAPIKTLSDE